MRPRARDRSQTRTTLEENVARAWERLRRRAKAQGIPPVKMHSTRHTWATLAQRAGKSVRWVAAQLGHADPALTLRVYAHAIRDEETDVSFADFVALPQASERVAGASPTMAQR